MLMQVGINIQYINTYLHHLLRLGLSCLGPHKTEAEVFAHLYYGYTHSV